MDIPSKLLLDLRNGRNIAKLVAWNHEEIQNGAYLVAIRIFVPSAVTALPFS